MMIINKLEKINNQKTVSEQRWCFFFKKNLRYELLIWLE
jgi:hypothetical protein